MNFNTLLIFSFLVCIGCNKRPEKIHLTTPKTAYSILTIIADEKGYFEDEGLDININYVKTGKIAMDDLLSGNADFSNVVETNVAFAGFLNADIEVLCSIEKVYDASIVARKDAGIYSPNDLKGKKIGVLLATTSQVFTDRFLAKHGIPKDSVELVNLLPPAMQSAIIEGSGVDAISIWQPYIYNVQNTLDSKNQITFSDKNIFTGYMTLTGNKNYIKNNPEVAKKMLKAYLRAEEFVKNNETEAMELVASFLNIPQKTVESIWSQYDISVGLDQQLIKDVKKEGKWIIETQKSHKNKSLPHYDDFFNKKILKSVSQQN